MSWWTNARIKDAVKAWASMAGLGTVRDVDDRFRLEVGPIGPAERAMIMGYRLACRRGHLEANQCPGPFAAIWAHRNGFPHEWLPEMDSGAPIGSIRSHVTGTGRLRWEAMDDGSIRIEVWRGRSEGCDKDPHLVLSAILRADARDDDYNDGISVEVVKVEGHAPFGVRHVDALAAAIAMAMGNDYSSFEDKAIRARIAALGTPEPDPWDPVNAPAVPPVGTRVRVVSEEIDHSYDARVTGAAAEWDSYQRGWFILVLDEGGLDRWALVREIRPAPEPEAEAPEA